MSIHRKATFPAWAAPAAIVVAGTAAYANSFRGAFVFDDILTVVEGQPATAAGRPLLALSLACNRAWNGFNPLGYHAVNLAIHIGAALLLFGLIRRTLSLPVCSARVRGAAPAAALVASLLWVVHPLTTEAVTSIVQRAESLMGFFYLLALYAYVRAAAGPRPLGWGFVAAAACWLGVGTKEVIVTAPLAMLCYDRAFLSPNFAEAWRRRRGLLLATCSSWMPLAALVAAGGGNRHGSIGWGASAAPFDYWMSQGPAVLRYFLLSFWPHPLILDYGAPSAPTPPEMLATAVVLAWAVGTVIAFLRRPAVVFPLLWVILILAPTCILPGTTQTVVEHRMYLPLAALLAAAVGAAAVTTRRSILLSSAVIAATALAAVTAARNRDYRSERTIWADTVAKRPGNALARYNLGHALAVSDPSAALREYREAVLLRPGYGDAHNGIGLLLAGDPARLPEAIAEYRAATAALPQDPGPHNNLAEALLRVPGGLDEAIDELQTAHRLAPGIEGISGNLRRAQARWHDNAGARLLGAPGRVAEAEAEFRTALALDPRDARAHANLGACLANQGRRDEAVAEITRALQLDPALQAARYNLEQLRQP